MPELEAWVLPRDSLFTPKYAGTPHVKPVVLAGGTENVDKRHRQPACSTTYIQNDAVFVEATSFDEDRPELAADGTVVAGACPPEPTRREQSAAPTRQGLEHVRREVEDSPRQPAETTRQSELYESVELVYESQPRPLSSRWSAMLHFDHGNPRGSNDPRRPVLVHPADRG